jgi:hypothetical protein
MVAVAAVASVAAALFFTSMVSAWVFMSSILVATALVPVTAALYLPTPPRPAAGLASSLTGLAVAVCVFGLTNLLGAYDEEWGTNIWTFELAGREWQLWQEYAVLFALPASMLGFALGQVFGRAAARPRIGVEQ